MTPARASKLVSLWVRLYTRNLSTPVSQRRIDEIEADVHDQVASERAQGVDEGQIALSILSRMVRGVTADISWRWGQARPVRTRHWIEEAMNSTTLYRLGLALAIASALFLLWGVAAMGIVGSEGDPFDRVYLAVLAVGLGVAVLGRFQAQGMALALAAMALAQVAAAVLALILGKHQSPVSSVAEILMVNALYVALFAASAWLFRQAARGRPSRSGTEVAGS